ncbi:MAG TPA: GNAT family protein [Candidatus Sulfotelmatobacter sp.]|nr:GNAT family protein [Candidatus Sulfotelmatobacter sp.]
MAKLTLETERLRLRPYREDDVFELLPLIGAREVAATTLRIPHPYTEQDARDFIASTQAADAHDVRRAITLRNDGRLIGGIGLHLHPTHHHAELGYWLGIPYWGHGYATEAAGEMLRFGFENVRLNRIFASHFSNNPASRNVLRKLGMRHEGSQREHVCKWGTFLDLEMYAILRREWQPSKEVRE